MEPISLIIAALVAGAAKAAGDVKGIVGDISGREIRD